MPPRNNTRPDPTTLLTTQISLLQTFSSFLTVALHTILYTRSLYPADTFLLTRAYNFPVRQNRHPLVCKWVLDTVSEVEKLMKKGVVSRVVVVLFSQHGEVMERFLFDVSRFPKVGEKQLYVPFEKRDDGPQQAGSGEEEVDERTEEEKLLRPHNLIDIEEQLRATIRHLSYSAEKLSPLPENCTYTVAVELKDEEDAQPPIEHLGIWEPTQPSLQTGDKGGSETVGRDLGGVKSVAVRNVESGEFVLESWIEEGGDKVRWAREEEERLRREDERAYDDD